MVIGHDVKKGAGEGRRLRATSLTVNKRSLILVAAVGDLVARDAECLRGQLVDVGEFDRSSGAGVVHRDRIAVEVAALHVANFDQDGDLSFDKMRGQFGNHVNLDRVIFAVGPGLRGPPTCLAESRVSTRPAKFTDSLGCVDTLFSFDPTDTCLSFIIFG